MLNTQVNRLVFQKLDINDIYKYPKFHTFKKDLREIFKIKDTSFFSDNYRTKLLLLYKILEKDYKCYNFIIDLMKNDLKCFGECFNDWFKIDIFYENSLYHACINGDIKICKYLIEDLGVELKIENIGYAAENGEEELVRYLIDRQKNFINTTIPNRFQYSMFKTLVNNHVDIIKELYHKNIFTIDMRKLRDQCNCKSIDKNNDFELYCHIIDCPSLSLLKYLKTIDEYESTPLFVAGIIEYNDTKIIDHLFNNNTDLDNFTLTMYFERSCSFEKSSKYIKNTIKTVKEFQI